MTDSISYEQFKTMFVNMDTEEYPKIIHEKTFVPSLILIGAFATNVIVMDHYSDMGIKMDNVWPITTIIFIGGGLLSMASFFLEWPVLSGN